MCLPVACGEQVETREIQRKISFRGLLSRYGATLSSNNLIGITLRFVCISDGKRLIVSLMRE